MSQTASKSSIRERIFRRIVAMRIPIVILFSLLAIAGIILRPLVGVDYNMSDYLPETAPSTVALHTMEHTYEGNIPSIRVMIEDVSIAQALDAKEKIKAVDGVTDVMWLDDVASIDTPLSMQDQKLVNTYYKDRCALFSVSVNKAQELVSVSEIQKLFGDHAALTGESVSTATATASTVKEVGIITVCGVAFVLIILTLTTYSWIEPFLILCGLGVSVAINAGSNLIFGQISFVSNAAGAVLQIAIALDFSVFLVHRLNECQGRYGSPEEDMVQALCKSSTAILASGCAVMIGFLALTVMQFKIGPDMGFVLAKGIFISLVVVFTFLPGLLLLCNRWMVKTAHRMLIRGMGQVSRIVRRLCIPLCLLFLLLPIPAYLATTSPEITYWYGPANIFGTQTHVGQDTQHIDEVFGQSDALALMVPAGNVVYEKELSRALKALPEVDRVISYVDAASAAIPRQMADAHEISKLDKDGWTRLIITMNVEPEGAQTHEAVAHVRQLAEQYYPHAWLLAGGIASTADLKTTITNDKDLVDIIAIVAVLCVLIVATRSIILPFILVFVIETSIWCNFAGPYLTHSPVFYLSYLIVCAIQLGVTVDYAILFSDRYCEIRKDLPKLAAIQETVKVTTIPILTSGLVLTIVGFVLGAVSSHGVISQLGHFLGVGVALSLIAVIFVLPGYLYLCDRLIDRLTLNTHFIQRPKRPVR